MLFNTIRGFFEKICLVTLSYKKDISWKDLKIFIYTSFYKQNFYKQHQAEI